LGVGKRALPIVRLCVLLYALHAVMDLFTGLTPIAWPFTGLGLYIQVSAAVSVSGWLSLLPTFKLVVAPVSMAMVPALVGVIATPLSVALAVATAIVEIAAALQTGSRVRLRG